MKCIRLEESVTGPAGTNKFGRSGCSILITPNQTIKKIAYASEYYSRLVAQRVKQECFSSQSYKNIVIPKVLSYGESWFEMEYLRMIDSISFFETTPYRNILFKIEIILDFVDNLINRSKVIKVDPEIISVKLNAIKNRVSPSIWFMYETYSRKIFQMVKKPFEILVGNCHGDLTFSNVLFSENKIGLIDFLDSFIDTPMMDIIKLRQDTKFHWTSIICSRSHDSAKIMVINSELDKIICRRFKEIIYMPGYLILDAMNYLRIVPYSQNYNFVQNALRCICA